MSDTTLYTVGEFVRASGRLYIERNADRQLVKHCLQGESSHVLASRQVGKTSLIVHAMNHLKQHATRTVFFDLQALGKDIEEEQWYNSFITTIGDQLEQSDVLLALWIDCANREPVIGPRLIRFFEELLRTYIHERLVIFIDEIDLMLSLGFSTDRFFLAIKALHNRRAICIDLNRLVFVFVGVTTPGELLRDPRMTRFDIGHHIELEDFGYEEAYPLTEGWRLPSLEKATLFGQALDWTGGHPYLLQKLCRAIAESPEIAWNNRNLEAVIRQIFMQSGGLGDDNIAFVRDMLIKRAPHPESSLKVLQTYQSIYETKARTPATRITDDEQSLIKCHLKLAGIVRRQEDWLVVRNRIYRKVFDGRWIREHMPIKQLVGI